MTQTATLTFDLTDPDAREAFELATKAQDMAMVLREFDEYLRNDSRIIVKVVREELHRTMSAHGINVFN